MMQSIHSNYSESDQESSKMDDDNQQVEKESKAMYFPFDEHWILAQKFSWEKNISISANKHFDTFALINSPEEKDWAASGQTYYVNGPKY